MALNLARTSITFMLKSNAKVFIKRLLHEHISLFKIN